MNHVPIEPKPARPVESIWAMPSAPPAPWVVPDQPGQPGGSGSNPAPSEHRRRVRMLAALVPIVLVLSLAGPTAEWFRADEPPFIFDPVRGRSGQASAAPEGRPSVDWTVPATGVFAVYDGTVVHADGGVVVARDGADGSVRWEARLAGEVVKLDKSGTGPGAAWLAASGVDDEKVASHFAAYRHDNGEQIWSRRIDARLWLDESEDRYVAVSRSARGGVVVNVVDKGTGRDVLAPTEFHDYVGLAVDTMLVSIEPGVLAAIDIEDATRRWTAAGLDVPRLVRGAVAQTASSFVVVAGPEMVALSRHTGRERWRVTAPKTRRVYALTGSIVVAAGEAARAYADPGARLLWEGEGWGLPAYASAAGKYLVETETSLAWLDLSTGETEALYSPGTNALLFDHAIVVVEPSGLVGRDLDGGRLWEIRIPWNEYDYFMTADGTVFVIGEEELRAYR